MTGRLRFGFAALGLGIIAAGALFAVSCGNKKPTSVDPAYQVPEGMPANGAQLVTWRELPNILAKYQNLPPVATRGPEDQFVGFVGVIKYPLGTVHGMVLDNTPANRYQVFRREPGGGLSTAFDFPLRPGRRWLDGQWETFEFSNFRPPEEPTYIARGLVGDVSNASSPLTNFSEPDADTLYNIELKFPNDVEYNAQHPELADNDTTVTWDPVPGATRYLVQIYQVVQRSNADLVLSGRPAPLYTESSRDFVVGASTAPLSFGLNQAFTGTKFTSRRAPKTVEYFVRVSAVGDHGQMIGVSYVQCESFDVIGDADPNFYYRFPLAAVRLRHYSKLGDQMKASCQPLIRDLAQAYLELLGGSSTSGVLRTSAFRLAPDQLMSAPEMFRK